MIDRIKGLTFIKCMKVICLAVKMAFCYVVIIMCNKIGNAAEWALGHNPFDRV